MIAQLRNNKNIWLFGGAAIAAFFLLRNKARGNTNWNNAQPAQYFTWNEVETTNTNLPNNIPDQWRPYAALLGQSVLDPIRNYINLPLEVNSWYRSQQVNQAVGGSATSKHLRAMAADIDTGNDEMNIAIMRAAISLQLPFDQLIAYGSWNAPTRVHVDIAEDEFNPKQKVGLKTQSGYEWLSLSQAALKYL